MFIIKPEKAEDWAHALFMLSYYHVSGVMYSDGETTESVYMVVGAHNQHPDEKYNDDDAIGLAEMCFQMNWHQGGRVCPDCEGTEDTCGHLTFTKPIDSAF